MRPHQTKMYSLNEINKIKNDAYAGKKVTDKKAAPVYKPPRPKDNPNSPIHKMQPKNIHHNTQTQKINIVDKSLIPVRTKTSTPKNKHKPNIKTTPKDTINTTTQKTAFNRQPKTTENTDSIENEVAVKNLLLSSTEEDTNTHTHTVHLQITEANKLMDTLLQTSIQTETQYHIVMEIDQEHEWETVKGNSNKQKDKDETSPPPPSLNEDKPPSTPTNANPDKANNIPQIIIDNITSTLTRTELVTKTKEIFNDKIKEIKFFKKGGMIITASDAESVNSVLKNNKYPTHIYGHDLYIHITKDKTDTRPWLCVNQIDYNKDTEHQTLNDIKHKIKSINKNIEIEGLHRKHKGPLPTTLILFKTTNEISQHQLTNSKITYNNKSIHIRTYIDKSHTQCTNCQRIGHTNKQCKKEHACVR